MNKIKKNDLVIVLTGRDRGRSGKVSKIVNDSSVIVDGINMIKKHVKPNHNLNQQGGIVKKESPIHLSNVALLNPSTKKADRVGFKVVDLKKVRYFKSNNELVD